MPSLILEQIYSVCLYQVWTQPTKRRLLSSMQYQNSKPGFAHEICRTRFFVGLIIGVDAPGVLAALRACVLLI